MMLLVYDYFKIEREQSITINIDVKGEINVSSS